MGRPRLTIIDDSQSATEIKDQKSKIKKTNKIDSAKSESILPVIASPAEGGVNSAKQSSTDGEDRHVIPQSGTPRDDKKSKAQKPGKTKPRGKKYQAVIQNLDRSKTYPLNEAIDLVKKMSYSKFNATLEAHINTTASGIRGLVSLPYASGRKLRILCFGPSTPQQIEGVIFGTESTIEEINKGKLDFDLVISTPAWMPKLAKVARILGPRGLMPNPKNGTITDDLKKAVTGFQAGKTEYKTESKAPVMHIAVGKINQPNEELIANIKILIQTVGKTRVKKITLSPTMGPGVKVDLASV